MWFDKRQLSTLWGRRTTPPHSKARKTTCRNAIRNDHPTNWQETTRISRENETIFLRISYDRRRILENDTNSSNQRGFHDSFSRHKVGLNSNDTRISYLRVSYLAPASKCCDNWNKWLKHQSIRRFLYSNSSEHATHSLTARSRITS